MTINREQDANGAWTYTDVDEHSFALMVEMLGDYSLERMDDFIEGRDRPLPTNVQAYLIAKRDKAFQAYKAGNYDLADAWIDGLQEACRFQGILPMARRGEIAQKQVEAISKLPRNTYKVNGYSFSITSITKRLATRKDRLGWVPPAELWQALVDELRERELDPEDHGHCISFDKNDACDRGEAKWSTFQTTISRERKKTPLAQRR